MSYTSRYGHMPTCEKVVMLFQVGMPCQEDSEAWLCGVSPSSASLLAAVV